MKTGFNIFPEDFQLEISSLSAGVLLVGAIPFVTKLSQMMQGIEGDAKRETQEL